MSGAALAVAVPSHLDLLRRIYRLAAPTTLVVVLQVIGQLAETWLAARQGTAALAGWAVVLPFALLMNMASAGAMGGGVVSAVARALGAGRPDQAGALVLHAVLIALTAGTLFAVLLAGMPSFLFTAIAGPATAEQAVPYAIWLFGAGAIPVWLTNTLASVLRGGGRHGLASRVLSTGGVASPFLAWFLMEPCGAGLKGAGMAVALVFSLSAIAMAIPVLRGAAGFVPHLRVQPNRAMFGRILSVGLVASMMAAIANLTTILVTAQIAHYGPAVVAAYGISARLEFLMIPLAFGIGSALTALVGQAVGAGDWATARRTAWTGGLFALGLAGCVGLDGRAFPLRVCPVVHGGCGGGLGRSPGAVLCGASLRRIRTRNGAVFRLDGGRAHERTGDRGVQPHFAGGRRRMGAGPVGRHGPFRSLPGGGYGDQRLWRHDRLQRTPGDLACLKRRPARDPRPVKEAARHPAVAMRQSIANHGIRRFIPPVANTRVIGFPRQLFHPVIPVIIGNLTQFCRLMYPSCPATAWHYRLPNKSDIVIILSTRRLCRWMGPDLGDLI